MMPPKTTLPPIDLTTRRPALGTLPSRAGLTDEEIETHSLRTGAAWGASQQIPAPAPAAPPPTRTARLGLIIPGYLDDQLREQSHRQRKSITALVMAALHQAGYQIDDADLVADKRRKT
ncbi:hypothetical protein [Niveispirillum fermenti]|uniref:hypothetical protein n=1 Tax=Niveispirillum fermenti TaxID=1233113 RepID=UPI003A835ADF